MKQRVIRALLVSLVLVALLFNIALASVVLSGGEYLPQDVRSFFVKVGILPPNVNIEITDYGYDCYDENVLSVLIENRGEIGVNSFTATVKFENGEQELEKEIWLPGKRERWVEFENLDCGGEPIKEVTITPNVIINDESVPYEEEVVYVSGGYTTGNGSSGNAAPVFSWEEGRPLCEFNCLEKDTILNSENPEIYGHKDFAFFVDQESVLHVISIKSIIETLPSSYYPAYSYEGENEFVHYTSNDLSEWTRQEDIIQTSENLDDYDSLSVWAPYVVFEEGVYYMFYTGVRWEDCPGAPDDLCYAQRIMMATSDDAYNWEKQGMVLDCDVDWTGWNVETEASQGRKACRDPMVHKKEDGTWIMYLFTQLNQADNKNAVVYATSDDLLTWNLETYIEATRGNLYHAESPFLFKYGAGYYLSFFDYPDEEHILRSSEPITDTSVNELVDHIEVPAEYLWLNNEELGDFLIMGAIPNFQTAGRPIRFYNINSMDGINLYKDSSSAYCFGCSPEPNLVERMGICDFDQDCGSDLGCADYSGFMNYLGNPLDETVFVNNLCCEISEPISPNEACCANAYAGEYDWASIAQGASECWEICGGETHYETEGVYPDLIMSGEGYCDSSSHCRCESWVCDWNRITCDGYEFF